MCFDVTYITYIILKKQNILKNIFSVADNFNFILKVTSVYYKIVNNYDISFKNR